MKADGILVCSQCYGTAHDLILENGKWSLLQCCYCNIGEWTDQRKPETKREGFRLKFGRHAGKTLAEVLSEPNGRQYLEWLAKTNEKLREIIRDHLAASQA